MTLERPRNGGVSGLRLGPRASSAGPDAAPTVTSVDAVHTVDVVTTVDTVISVDAVTTAVVVTRCYSQHLPCLHPCSDHEQ